MNEKSDNKTVFVEIKQDNIHLLEKFLAQAGTSLNSFRYFDKRPLTIIQNHVYTCLYLNEDKQPLCYGHLDKEDGIVWLGIAVVEGQTGQGIGKKMMHYLVDKAQDLKLPFIQLAVDTDNISAQRLYEKFGFTSIKKTDKYNLMKKVLTY